LWLTPSTLGTKIMAVGQTAASICARLTIGGICTRIYRLNFPSRILNVMLTEVMEVNVLVSSFPARQKDNTVFAVMRFDSAITLSHSRFLVFHQAHQFGSIHFISLLVSSL
jgi:hypothetical protein